MLTYQQNDLKLLLSGVAVETVGESELRAGVKSGAGEVFAALVEMEEGEEGGCSGQMGELDVVCTRVGGVTEREEVLRGQFIAVACCAGESPPIFTARP